MLFLAIIWIGGNTLIVRPVGILVDASKRLAAGDLTVRSGLVSTQGEFGQLGRAFDEMAEEIQRREEEFARLAMAVDQSAEAVVITDREGTILYVNPAFERITGYSREEAVGKNPRILRSGKHDESFYREMWETLLRGEVWEGHFINRKKDGSLYEEDATISPVRDSAGNIVSFVAVKRDVTRLLSLEKQVRMAQKMEAVGTLAGGIAHDFNNALTVIIGFGEMLKRRIANDPKSVSDLDQILGSAERASVLTRQLLTFARRQIIDLVNPRLEPGGDRPRKTPPEGHKGRHRDQDVPRGEPDDDPRGPGTDRPDPDESMPERPGRHAGGGAPCHRDRGDLAGRGIPEAVSVHEGGAVCGALGERYRDRNGRKDPGAGVRAVLHDEGPGQGNGPRTGRRLRDRETAQRVHPPVQRAGERVDVPGLFPRSGRSCPIRRLAASHAVTLGGNETILLTEDEESVRNMMEQTLKSYGYRVLAARDGEEAVDIFRRQGKEIAIAVLDVVMPKMGGKQAYDEMIKRSPELEGPVFERLFLQRDPR